MRFKYQITEDSEIIIIHAQNITTAVRLIKLKHQLAPRSIWQAD